MRDRIFCIDLTRRMVFLLGVYVRIVKVTDSTQVINFWEKANGKIHFCPFFFVAFVLVFIEFLDIIVLE